MKNILLCQIHKDYIYTNNELEQEFEDSFFQYAAKDGYVKHDAYYEYPLWVARISYLFKEHKEYQLHYKIINKNDVVNFDDYDYVLFSVLDCNKDIIMNLVSTINPDKTKVITGGYTIIKHSNIFFINTIEGLANYFKIRYTYGLDYSLFKKEKTIPRLTLSTNCNFNCNFCTIEKGVKPVEDIHIYTQMGGISKLSYDLIYIDDKTFTQYKDWENQMDTVNLFRKNTLTDNPTSYIIQTSPLYFVGLSLLVRLSRIGVKFIEFGLESYNDNILKLYNKPFRVDMVDRLMRNLKIVRANYPNIHPIFNLICGYEGETKETYDNTYKFLEDNIDIIYSVNLTKYTDYSDKNNKGQLSLSQEEGIIFQEKVMKLFINKFKNEKLI